jgi:flagellar hook-basal body complex protein FliE
MAIAPVATGLDGTGGVNLDQLAQVYQQQVTTGFDPASGVSDSAVDKAAMIRGANFGDLIAGGLQKVENLDMVAQSKAIQAATGDLNDVHDYVIAATEAQTATELTTTLRNKALDSFNEIMRMPL